MKGIHFWFRPGGTIPSLRLRLRTRTRSHGRPEISKIEFCYPIYDPSGWDGGRVPMVDFQVLV